MGHRYHQMELVPGVKPPTKAPYRKSLLELQELRQQLSKMLDVGYVKPLNALMVLLSFSKGTKMVPCGFVLIVGL